MDIAGLILSCGLWVHPATAQAPVAVESGFNPYAIGIVGARLQYQPSSFEQAVATAGALRGDGWNFSAGLAQINVKNWQRLGLTARDVFEPCANLRAMQRILVDCYVRAPAQWKDGQARLRAALSCYHAGDFSSGWRDGYVQRVEAAARMRSGRTTKGDFGNSSLIGRYHG